MARNACIEDLRNYFKKSDLLSGLTQVEQQLLRENIGLITDDSGNKINEEVTYEELLTKIANKSLSAGLHYIITDYLTIYWSNSTTEHTNETWGYDSDHVLSPTWHLIVTAVSDELLDEHAIIAEHPEYHIHYDVTKVTFADGVSNKGTITLMRDPNNNLAPYDFKNVKFWRTFEGVDLKFYTFSYRDSNREIADASETSAVHDNIIQNHCWNNVFMGDTCYNIIESDSIGNTFYKGCTLCHFYWDTCKNTFECKVVDLSGTMSGLTIELGNYSILSSYITKQIHNVGSGIIVTYLDLATYSLQIVILKENNIESNG